MIKLVCALVYINEILHWFKYAPKLTMLDKGTVNGIYRWCGLKLKKNRTYVLWCSRINEKQNTENVWCIEDW